jgi:tubulin polyglutamylase TTLL6/13
MDSSQKINHFPGMLNICRKNLLAKHMAPLARMFPDEFDFVPKTWVLPAEMSDFRSEFAGRPQTFIIKPDAGCQGKGIYLIKSTDHLTTIDRCVAQRYLEKPYLIEGLKFDFRIYVLITSLHPMRIFIHEEGLARFATVPYVKPNPNNLKSLQMHLTNYAINKDSDKFIYNTDAEEDYVGHKRSLTSVFGELEDRGVDIDDLWGKI